MLSLLLVVDGIDKHATKNEIEIYDKKSNTILVSGDYDLTIMLL